MRRELIAASNELKRFKRQLDTAINRGLDKTARVGLAEAKKRSRGRTSLAQLRREGHPYATRQHAAMKTKNRKYRDPSIINKQKGDFEQEWHISKGRGLIDALAIVNFAPEAEYLAEGTHTMMRRNVDDKVIEIMAKVGITNLDSEVQKITR